MTNREISKTLKLTGDLLELHSSNEFKIRAFRNASFSIDRLETELSITAKEHISTLDGVGKSMSEHVLALLEKGTFDEFEQLKLQTPVGVLDMLQIKGLGPKKVHTLWKEHAIDSLETLTDACKTHTIASIKGFGLKTEEAILKSIETQASYEGLWLYADLEPLAEQMQELINKSGQFTKLEVTGAFRRKLETLGQLEFLGTRQSHGMPETTVWPDELEFLNAQSGPFLLRFRHRATSLTIWVHLTEPEQWAANLVRTTGSVAHLRYSTTSGASLQSVLKSGSRFENESSIYDALGTRYMEPLEREGYREFECDVQHVLKEGDLTGILHNHSTYSDGKHTVQEMANRCKHMGYKYFGIADHSKSAFYARGLQEEKVFQQWKEIDALNQIDPTFRIFRGIESDILNDGSLDYSDEVLAGFDYVVASVHSNLRMDFNKATNRILKAIEQPYTTMLGHISGRLLLRREGYPLDYHRILDALHYHEVILELNADPWRLDIDWRFLRDVEKRGILISINPDAHEMDGLQNIRFGYYAARKACFPKELVVNAKNVEEVAAIFKKRKK